ncbi:MAG: GNAT family N-acetyltransferase [Deltaproteobacteria bacterium]|nr:GNAT family N-acetyltransferase [Deltaproteobacteria bacterium]MCD6265145.1 GNAT family N-acetyltransferase [Deltaproteobacteria bacterium]
MENFDLSKIVIRGIKESDVDAIVEIEEKNLGIKRERYWKRELQKNKEGRFLGSCVAEIEGKVIGFILGDIGSREFGMPENMGWIHTIGVHPDYHHKGVARALFDDYKKRFLKLDVDTVYTIVSLSDNMQLPFFEKIGFRPGNRIYLEMDITKETPKTDRVTDYEFRRIM